MQTFIAHIIYRIHCLDVRTEQYDEQWRFIMAADQASAVKNARAVALDEEATFTDRHGRLVQWQFVAIKDLQPVQLENGALLFSRIQELEPVADLPLE